MNGTVPALKGIMHFTLTSYSAAADTTEPLSTKIDRLLHAVITEMPDIIDMSADPKTWSSLAQRVWAPNAIEIKLGPGQRPNNLLEWLDLFAVPQANRAAGALARSFSA
jgi:hypothetical protein